VANSAAICSASWSKHARNVMLVCLISLTCLVNGEIDIACDVMVGESLCWSGFVCLLPATFRADFHVFLVLSPDLIIETVSSSNSSSSCTCLRFGNAGSGGGFSAAQYKSSSSAIATVNILSLVFFTHSSTRSQ